MSYEVRVASDKVLILDDFLSGEESDEILKAGSRQGTRWARSQAGDGVQAARTSSTPSH